MKRFKNVLLVCDDRSIHPEVIGRAIALAKANGASLTLVDVVEGEPGELARMFGALPGLRAHDVEYELVEFHRSRLAELAGPIKSEGLATSMHVLQGNPFVEIIRKVLRDDHDLVIKGAAGDAGHPLFASTDLHLMRKCPCPVWVMKKSGRRQYARIVAAVDPDPEDATRDALNHLIMDLSTSLSKLDGSELHIVNAWRLEEEETLRHSGFARISTAEVEMLVESRRKRSAAALEALLSDYPAVGAARHVHHLKGAARTVIPDFARKQRAELVVMGTVARTGIRGLIIGNTAEAILNDVDCAILAVKPTGFETPVRLEGPAEDEVTREVA